MKEFTADYVRTLFGNEEKHIELVARPFIEEIQCKIEKIACACGSSLEYELDDWGPIRLCIDFIETYFKERGFKVRFEYGDPVCGTDILVIEW